MKQFLKDIKIEWTKTELIAMYNWTIKTIKEEQIDSYIKTSNLYYLPGVDSDLEDWKRASDRHVKVSNRFCIDIDIRNQYDWELTNLEIVKEGLFFVEHLHEYNELFWQWSKIIFTWNWLHILYQSDAQDFDHRQYKLWVQHIFKMWDEFIWNKVLFSDHACCNIWRILRIWGSINQKNWATVRIIWEQNKNSTLVNNIKLYALIEAEAERIKNIESSECFKITKQRTEGEWIYEQIQALPAYSIALHVVPQFPYDWKKNFRNEKKWFTAYFYVSETNSICNWGSRYFNFWDANSCFGPFQIIKNHYNYTNAQTFEWFKDNIFK